MTDDWLLGIIAEIECAAEIVRERLGAVDEVLMPARRERVAGVPLLVIAEGLAERGRDPRRQIAAAVQDYEHAVAALRARVVRALVDEEGVTRSTLARRMGVSRQAVTRLYEAGGTASKDRK